MTCRRLRTGSRALPRRRGRFAAGCLLTHYRSGSASGSLRRCGPKRWSRGGSGARSRRTSATSGGTYRGGGTQSSRATRSTSSPWPRAPWSRSANGLLDIKRLRQVDEDELEQWVPTLKAPSRDRARRPGRGHHCPGRRQGRRAQDPTPSTVDGCLAELTEVRAGGTTTERRGRVGGPGAGGGLRRLGLASLPNTNYARGLAELVGFGGRRYAVIDVGTNSVKFVVAERAAVGRMADDRRPRRGDPARRGLSAAGRSAGADAAHGRCDRGHDDAGQRARGHRGRRPSGPRASGWREHR